MIGILSYKNLEMFVFIQLILRVKQKHSYM